MSVQIRRATSKEDREIVGRLTYDVYVEERRFDFGEADHEGRTMRGEADDACDFFIAWVDRRPVGSIRIELGSRSHYGPHDREVYGIERFASLVAHSQTCLVSRLLVIPELRSTAAPFLLMRAATELARDEGVLLGFSYCEPHLVNLYLSVGWRPYKELVNHEEAGLLAPLVFVTCDPEYLGRVGSPLRAVFDGRPAQPELARGIAQIIDDQAAIHSPITTQTPENWSEAYDFLSTRGAPGAIFADMTEDETSRMLQSSLVIDCRRGDHLISQGKTTRTLFVILEGSFEVRDRDQLLAVRGPGEVLGEVALLLSRPRMGNVIASSDEARVLALSEGTIRKLMDTDAELASKLLLFLAKALCGKLVERSPAANGS